MEKYNIRTDFLKAGTRKEAKKRGIYLQSISRWNHPDCLLSGSGNCFPDQLQ